MSAYGEPSSPYSSVDQPTMSYINGNHQIDPNFEKEAYRQEYMQYERDYEPLEEYRKHLPKSNTPKKQENDIKNSQALLNAVQRRKQAERDLQLLANRIQMLKHEEQKALHKIDKNRKKAEKILKQREENDKKLAERLHIAKLEADDIEKVRSQHHELEKKMRNATMKRIALNQNKKLQEVKDFRKEKRVQREGLIAEKLLEVQKKREQRTIVKAYEENVRREREREKQRIIEKNKAAYQAKIRKEEAEAKKKEKEVLKMEKVEMQLIEQLKNTQLTQAAACAELEVAMHF